MPNYTDHIEIILRAIIVHNSQILLCHSREKPPIYFLPGGHLERGETMEQAMSREIKEEIGTKILAIRFLEVSENFYQDNRGQHHEINLIFEVSLDTDNFKHIESCEEHICITWLGIEKLPTIRFLPRDTHKYLINYFKKR